MRHTHERTARWREAWVNAAPTRFAAFIDELAHADTASPCPLSEFDQCDRKSVYIRAIQPY
jgi:hypothetical protein